jgi:hypothetical protein
MKAVSETTETTQEPSENVQGELGPIQLLVIGFPRTDLFKGEVLDELAILEDRGTIRVLDLLYVEKTGEDELMVLEIEDLGSEASSFGGALSAFLGIDGAEPAGGGSVEVTVGGEVFGLSGVQARASLAAMPVGTAAGIILFEHIWAIHFRDAARRAGGNPVLQGLLTPEAVLMIGEETRAIREAAVAVEFAEILEGAALLDAVESIAAAAVIAEAAEATAIAALEQATAVEAYAAARAVRALIAAGVIEQYAAAEAIHALRYAGLLLSDQTAMQDAGE